MIKYIKRKDLDVLKYDDCIESSYHSKVYGFSWYLDIVAENWDALVLDDYKAVMPITWKLKSKIKYIIQPYFCQQISIYSCLEVTDSLIVKFFKKIPKTIFYTNLNLSIKPPFSSVITKNNYVLNLNNNYKDIYKSYRKDRKKSLKKAEDASLFFKDFNNKEELISLYCNVFGYLKMPNKYYKKIEDIIDFCLKNNKGFIRNVYFKDKIVCIGFFLISNSNIYYLLGASNTIGKKHGATTFLLDSVIKDYSNTKFIFDFEGSTVKSIASFYKSFGSDLTHYYNYKSNAIKRVFL